MSFDEYLPDDPALKVSFPTCLVRLHFLFEDLGQEDPDRLVGPIKVTPVEWTVESNSYQEADTFEIVLDGDMPDPRTAKGVTAEIFFADARARPEVLGQGARDGPEGDSRAVRSAHGNR